MINTLQSFWGCLSRRRHYQFFLLMFLMLCVAFSELLNVGAIIPFLTAITYPDRLLESKYLSKLFDYAGVVNKDQLRIFTAVSFAAITAITNLLRLLFLWSSTRYSYLVGGDFSYAAFRNILYQPYKFHLNHSSSYVLDGLSKAGIAGNIIGLVANFISAIVMLVAILLALMLINPIVAICAFGGFGAIYAMVVILSKRKLKDNGIRAARSSVEIVKNVQEGLGGIRDILIDGTQEVFAESFKRGNIATRRAQGSVAIISGSPRFIVETFGIFLITAIAYFLSKNEDSIPVLGALALGAQRLIPVLQQAYGSWSGLHGSMPSLEVALTILKLPGPLDRSVKIDPINFSKNITLQGVGFKYENSSSKALSQINLSILKGSKIGFIGKTGSGKSTLLDIVMGLLPPSYGSLLVDEDVINSKNNQSWQKKIAHVPQSIFLTDSSIEENIAFGVKKAEIDFERVKLAAHKAQIAEMIGEWPDGYQTLIGERGIRLSGGQRQRIGLARALYKQAELIILDEATSALDSETESLVMDAIDGLDDDNENPLTVLIIAHRLTTLKNCELIYELERGEICKYGTYDEMVLAKNKI